MLSIVHTRHPLDNICTKYQKEFLHIIIQNIISYIGLFINFISYIEIQCVFIINVYRMKWNDKYFDNQYHKTTSMELQLCLYQILFLINSFYFRWFVVKITSTCVFYNSFTRLPMLYHNANINIHKPSFYYNLQHWFWAENQLFFCDLIREHNRFLLLRRFYIFSYL